MEQEKLLEALGLLLNARHAIALTGAGISTLSGIPDFRSPETGLWNRYDPEKIFHIDFFYKEPQYFYTFARQYLFKNYAPNIVHYLLAQLQKHKILKKIITQNIDMLHQKAGSTDIVELHGSNARNYCVECGEFYTIDEVLAQLSCQPVPKCKKCYGIIKPDIIFFGETLHKHAIRTAFSQARQADCCLVLGTSLVVYPAASIPEIVIEAGGELIIVNLGSTPLDNLARYHFQMGLDTFCEEILKLLSHKKIIPKN